MKQLYLFVLLVCASATSHAALIRVNNNAGYAAAYSTVTAAVAAANAGDTIYVEPSPTAYDQTSTSLQINKKLTIVGNGYFLTTNTNLQVRNNNSEINARLQFMAGSQGSVVMGIYSPVSIDVLTDNIIVKRCRISTIHIGYSGDSGTQANTTQTQVLECYMTTLFAEAASLNTDIIVKNNIIQTAGFSQGDNGIFENNTVYGGLSFNNGVFNVVNNLVQDAIYNFGNCATSHNTCACASNFPTGSNNTTGQPWVLLFLGGSDDQFYRTNPAGAAANTGFYGNGDDRGAFTDAPGRSTYRLGGIPEFPAIYKLLGGGTVSGPTIQVTVSARSNN